MWGTLFSRLYYMSVRIDPTWLQALSAEWDKPYFSLLTQFVRQEYQRGECYPPAPLVFHAFDACPFDKVRVVIIGQDPYHEPGQAMGLSFSVPEGVQVPPSLQNIYKEIARERTMGLLPAAVAGSPSMTSSGDLRPWAAQGVLLLNATLTVRAHQAGSHQNKGWEEFTDAAIQALNQGREHLVFMLWGSYAQRKGAYIDKKKHLVLTTSHPSPLSVYRGFDGCSHFAIANNYLISNGLTPIDW